MCYSLYALRSFFYLTKEVGSFLGEDSDQFSGHIFLKHYYYPTKQSLQKYHLPHRFLKALGKMGLHFVVCSLYWLGLCLVSGFTYAMLTLCQMDRKDWKTPMLRTCEQLRNVA